MTNVIEHTLERKTKRNQVSLSNYSQSHRFYIQVSVYQNDEAKIKVKHSTQFNLTTPPPTRQGELVQNGITTKARAKIKLTARLLEHIALKPNSVRAYCSMITLTYGKDYPSDKISKLHLDHFLKRLRRFHDKEYPNTPFHYLWVLEKQKRGAPHYHILTPHYVPHKEINRMWNGIVLKWQRQNKKRPQKVMPNVIAIFKAGAYLAKYLSKEGEKLGGNSYSMSKDTRELIQPNDHVIELSDNALKAHNTSEYLANKITSKGAIQFVCTNKHEGTSNYWLSNINTFMLGEALKYDFNNLPLQYSHEKTD